MRKYKFVENHANDSRVKIIEDDVCPTLSSRMGTGGNNVPLVINIDEEEYDIDTMGCSE